MPIPRDTHMFSLSKAISSMKRIVGRLKSAMLPRCLISSGKKSSDSPNQREAQKLRPAASNVRSRRKQRIRITAFLRYSPSGAEERQHMIQGPACIFSVELIATPHITKNQMGQLRIIWALSKEDRKPPRPVWLVKVSGRAAVLRWNQLARCDHYGGQKTWRFPVCEIL